MSLTPTDYDNIDFLFNTEIIIYDYYCKISKLEKNKNLQDDKVSLLIKKLELMKNSENNYLESLVLKNYNKIDLVKDIIEKKSDKRNLDISKRINLKIDIYLQKLLYDCVINKNNNYSFNSLQVNEIIQRRLELAINNDITKVFCFYINNEIITCNNDYIKSQLIRYRYRELFYNLCNDNEIINYLNIKNITLDFDFVYDFIGYRFHLKYNDFEKQMLKELFLEEATFKYVSNLLAIDDSSLSNEDEMAKVIWLKSYIKACSFLLESEQRKKIISYLTNRLKNTVTKSIIITAFEDGDEPAINKVIFKIK